ncbi:ubiquinone biosynthesis O-methyltransferase, mitochondrial-like [Oppia nitens]|uniref:ubiquinone biosynthesis O-methyltransferase, mitochondrial-like n=1 Tax=Oppia nitens TaxID=1686743 RepID=UPI0023DC51F8|nr:ubiquinone biosynthesis O-methyltransferase, mitochondrial-like [Oppia nitens]
MNSLMKSRVLRSTKCINSCLLRAVTRVECRPRFIITTTKGTGDHRRSTIRPEEMDKFESLKDNWWNRADFEPLLAMNELRVPFIRDAFKPSAPNTATPLAEIRLLEIGCGGGLLSEPLARLGANVTAIDPISNSIEMAINHAKQDDRLTDNLTYECVTIEELSARDELKESFDGVIASEVVEHVDDIDYFLKCGLKCLKPDGKLLITTINQTPIAALMAILMAEYVLQLVPKGMHQYKLFVKPSALELLLHDHNCYVNLIHGMGYNPLTKRWFWTHNQCVNYALKATKHL